MSALRSMQACSAIERMRMNRLNVVIYAAIQAQKVQPMPSAYSSQNCPHFSVGRHVHRGVNSRHETHRTA
jgi:hypothetical protein